MDSDTRFVLTTPIAYGNKNTGESSQAQFIEIREPTGILVMDAAPIRQSLVRAFQENEDRAERQDREKRSEVANNPDAVLEEETIDLDDSGSARIDPVTMLAVLSMSSVDLRKLYEHVREMLLKPGVAFVDGEVPFTSALFDSLSLSDAESLIGTYCGSFFRAS
jgi:hypothetical protein